MVWRLLRAPVGSADSAERRGARCVGGAGAEGRAGAFQGGPSRLDCESTDGETGGELRGPSDRVARGATERIAARKRRQP